MTTVVNTPPAQESNSGNGMGFLMGIILLIIVGLLFFYYGLPAIRQSAPQQSDINVDVPEQIDVNVTNPQDGQ